MCVLRVRVFCVRVSVCACVCLYVSLSHSLTPVCVDSERLHVYARTTRTCVSSCARGAGFERTHGDVFERTHGEQGEGSFSGQVLAFSSRTQTKNGHFLSIISQCQVHASSPIICLP